MADENKTQSFKPNPSKVEPVAESKTERLAALQHGDYVPTEADYERARTVGAGAPEGEYPPGVVRK